MITSLFGFLSAFSHSFAMFVTMRFFTGLGLSGINLSTVVLGGSCAINLVYLGDIHFLCL